MIPPPEFVSFVEAIDSDPLEATHYAVLADWLEENMPGDVAPCDLSNLRDFPHPFDVAWDGHMVVCEPLVLVEVRPEELVTRVKGDWVCTSRFDWFADSGVWRCPSYTPPIQANINQHMIRVEQRGLYDASIFYEDDTLIRLEYEDARRVAMTQEYGTLLMCAPDALAKVIKAPKELMRIGLGPYLYGMKIVLHGAPKSEPAGET